MAEIKSDTCKANNPFSHLIRLSYLNSKNIMASASIMSFNITLERKQQGIIHLV